MAGYDWQSGMSCNAVAAYENGEMPLSKWTKKAILEAVQRKLEDKYELDKLVSKYGDAGEELLKGMKKATLEELRKEALRECEYHHTSKFYNITFFYELKDLCELFEIFGDKLEFFYACDECRKKTAFRFFSFCDPVEQYARTLLYERQMRYGRNDIVCCIAANDEREAMQHVIEFFKKDDIKLSDDAINGNLRQMCANTPGNASHYYGLSYDTNKSFCKYWVVIRRYDFEFKTRLYV